MGAWLVVGGSERGGAERAQGGKTKGVGLRGGAEGMKPGVGGPCGRGLWWAAPAGLAGPHLSFPTAFFWPPRPEVDTDWGRGLAVLGLSAFSGCAGDAARPGQGRRPRRTGLGQFRGGVRPESLSFQRAFRKVQPGGLPVGRASAA